MAGLIGRLFKTQPKEIDPGINAALRELAGWPLQETHRGGYRARGRQLTVVRDQFGNVIHSVEVIDEDEYDEYSDTWGK